MSTRIPVVELIRVSTAEQAKEGRAGIARQEAACRRAVENHGLEVVRAVRLIDVSGTCVQNAPEMDEIMGLIRVGRARGIVAADFDRLLRPDDFRSLAVLQDIKEAGALIYLPDQAVDLNTQGGWLISGMQSMIAGNELAQIKKRLNGAKEAMRRRGEHPGADNLLPLGVSYDRKAKRYYYNDDAPLVARIFEAFYRGEQNISELGRMFGIERARAGKMLRNQLYIGWRVYDRRRGGDRYARTDGRMGEMRKVPRPPDEVFRVHVIEDPLVPEALFWAVQDILDGRSRKIIQARMKGRGEALFAGFVRCGICGERIYTSGRGEVRRGARYYVCRRLSSWCKKRGMRCTLPRLQVPKVDAMLVEFVASRLADEEYVLAQTEGLVSRAESTARAQEIEQGERQIAAIKRKRARLLDVYLNGDIEREDLDKKAEELRREQERTEARVARLRTEASETDSAQYADAVRQIAEAFAEFPFWTRKEQRAILEDIRPEFWITPDGVTKASIPIRTIPSSAKK